MSKINKLPQAFAVLASCLFVLVFLPDVCLAQEGTLDPTFGTGGLVTTDFGGLFDRAFSLALQSGDKIVVAGFARFSGSRDFALARYNPNGTLDVTFDGDGKVVTDFAGLNDTARDVAIQSGDKIVVAGQVDIPGPFSNFTDVGVARYLSTGSLDPTFGTGGKITTVIGGPRKSFVSSLAIQPDGRIVVAGSHSFGQVTGQDAVARGHHGAVIASQRANDE